MYGNIFVYLHFASAIQFMEVRTKLQLSFSLVTEITSWFESRRI